MTYHFAGFLARPSVVHPKSLPPGAVWRDIVTPFVGVGVRLSRLDDDELLSPPEAESLAAQMGLDTAECWVYLDYFCWGGGIDFVYGFGSRNQGIAFGPVWEVDATDAVVSAYTDLMEWFGVPVPNALHFSPFVRGFWET